jgi:hypothetical protein
MGAMGDVCDSDPKPLSGHDVFGVLTCAPTFFFLSFSPSSSPLPFTNLPFMIGESRKRTAAEPAPDTRASARVRVASSKHRENSKHPPT